MDTDIDTAPDSETPAAAGGWTTRKIVLLGLSLGAGGVVALVLCSVALVATGAVRQSPFGGVRWNLGGAAGSDFDQEAYERNQALEAGLVWTVSGDHRNDHGVRLMVSVHNPADDDFDDIASINVIFRKDGEIAAIESTVADIAVPAGGTKEAVLNVYAKELPAAWDEITILPE